MTEGEALARALLDPAAWPHPADDLQLLETHISWVVLAGDYAYKIKKPLALDFLDFSTLAARRRSCELELRLNRRWAPDLYLEVVKITGSASQPRVAGGGEAIEYAVRMRRFPQSALLSRQLEDGRLDAADMRELAEMLADRHGSAPARREPAFGSPAAIRKPMLENFPPLAPWLEPDRLSRLRRWTEDELERHEALLLRRMQEGFVRECHGDLHLRNLVRLDEGIVAFDCVEFSEPLRTLDVISDLTFLSMDLAASGRPDLAWILLNRYLEVSGDYGGMRLYGLYYVYHCLIRAKVAAIRAGERHAGERREPDLDAMQHYCDVALEWLDRGGPALIVMHGLSGSGKTRVSSRLMASLGAVRLRSDIERKRLAGLAEGASSGSAPGGGLYEKNRTEATYRRLFDLAGELLSAGHRVILDASFLSAGARRRAKELAAGHGAGHALIAIEAPRDVLAARLAARAAGGRQASEADADVLEYQIRHADPLDDRLDGPVLHFENREGADTDVLLPLLADTLRPG